jgi:AraC-like DNA-binding protein
MKQFDSVGQYNSFFQLDTPHPLVSVIDFSKVTPQQQDKMHFGIYAIFLKDMQCGELRYGRNLYDYQDGSLVFIAPGQVIAMENEVQPTSLKGYGLLFHSDAIKGTPLANHFQDYSFFSYHANEALHLSIAERQIIIDCLSKINTELQQTADKHSKKVIAANLDLLLSYCARFYDRQFTTRDHTHQGILEKFEALLHDFFQSDKPGSIGLPSVAYFASALHLSPKYFGDLVKKETGKSAQEYIHSKIIDLAKSKIFEINKPISQIAYDLGFKYPQHFTRLFRQHVGHTPNAYRTMN